MRNCGASATALTETGSKAVVLLLPPVASVLVAVTVRVKSLPQSFGGRMVSPST